MASAKEPILKAAGYTYNFNRMVYLNRAARKAFSVEWIEDHPAELLKEKIDQATETGEWQLYFNTLPTPTAVREFLAELQ